MRWGLRQSPAWATPSADTGLWRLEETLPSDPSPCSSDLALPPKEPLAVPESLSERHNVAHGACDQAQSKKVAEIWGSHPLLCCSLHWANLTFSGPQFPCLYSSNKHSLTDLSSEFMPGPWSHRFRRGCSWGTTWDELPGQGCSVPLRFHPARGPSLGCRTSHQPTPLWTPSHEPIPAPTPVGHAVEAAGYLPPLGAGTRALVWEAGHGQSGLCSGLPVFAHSAPQRMGIAACLLCQHQLGPSCRDS